MNSHADGGGGHCYISGSALPRPWMIQTKPKPVSDIDRACRRSALPRPLATATIQPKLLQTQRSTQRYLARSNDDYDHDDAVIMIHEC